MLIAEQTVQRILGRMVAKMEDNHHLREDMMQEALLHLWSEEGRNPGQTRSWYLQNVQFHLTHLKMSGRSVDSVKHREAQVSLPGDHDSTQKWPGTLQFDEGIMSEVNSHDIVSLLKDRLDGVNLVILDALVNGFGVCEIAEQLGASDAFVSRHRRKIASLLVKLGIVQFPAGRLHHSSSTESGQPA
jgi:DNA-directed RNA polymerase specialized sigma24 family protein